MIPTWVMTLIHFAGFTVAILAAMKFGETENMRYFMATIIAACFAVI